ncbi:MAG TPA: GNAT family N-acetyltransferase [Candidatus Nitrosopolaris sp.]|nr:GNAT family N-acetyltransferase [Candidatus Nitrosopolaris sp.]
MTTTVVGGTQVALRLLQPCDAELLRNFFRRLSSETIYRRFLSPVTAPNDALVKRLVDVDHCEREALIALDDRGIVGVARYGTERSATHDVAVVVADEWQGRGLGTLLMRRLAHIARSRGIASFHATMLGDNMRAQPLVRRLSSRTTMRFEGGYLEAEIPLRPR